MESITKANELTSSDLPGAVEQNQETPMQPALANKLAPCARPSWLRIWILSSLKRAVMRAYFAGFIRGITVAKLFARFKLGEF